MISQIDNTDAANSRGHESTSWRRSLRLRAAQDSDRILRGGPTSGGLDAILGRRPVTLSLASTRPAKSQRLGSIDAVRGTAMLFVFLAHFTSVYLWRIGARDLASYLGVVSMIASPTFVTVSGMVVGFLAVTNPAGFRDLRIKLLDRGVFLLIIGHLILAVTVTPTPAGFARAYRTSFITDAIAVAIILGPWLMDALSDMARIGLAATTFLLNWVAVVQWHPAAGGLGLFKRYFVGVSGTPETDAIPVFAVIPWFAVYLAATVLGRRVGKMYATGDRKGADQLLARTGGVLFLLGGVVHGATMVLRRVQPDVIALDPNLLTFFSIYQKFPPGPVYLAFFGGAGIMLLAAILEVDRRGKIPSLMNKLRQIGRASLFTFIAQYALYVAFLARLRLPYTPLWPALFLISIIVLAAGAAVWDQHDGNRFLTVGITSLLRRSALPARFGVS